MTPEKAGLFAYGTLEIPDVMRAVAGRVPPARRVRLDGYARALLVGRTYPGVIARAGASTAGTLYEGLEAAEWNVLDAFEDDCYERRSVEVVSRTGAEIEAVAYVIPPARARQMTDTPWDRLAYERDHLQALLREWHGRRPLPS